MKLRRKLTALALVVGAPIAASVATAAPASAATVSVAVSVGSWHCPAGYTPYVRGVDGTGAYGYGGINTWTGYARTAYVTVYGVPSSGMPVNVVVAYSCQGSWWRQTTPAPIYAQRWVYGSGYQPSWTV
jgi:hypothetical protein